MSRGASVGAGPGDYGRPSHAKAGDIGQTMARAKADVRNVDNAAFGAFLGLGSIAGGGLPFSVASAAQDHYGPDVDYGRAFDTIFGTSDDPLAAAITQQHFDRRAAITDALRTNAPGKTVSREWIPPANGLMPGEGAVEEGMEPWRIYTPPRREPTHAKYLPA